MRTTELWDIIMALIRIVNATMYALIIVIIVHVRPLVHNEIKLNLLLPMLFEKNKKLRFDNNNSYGIFMYWANHNF